MLRVAFYCTLRFFHVRACTHGKFYILLTFTYKITNSIKRSIKH